MMEQDQVLIQRGRQPFFWLENEVMEILLRDVPKVRRSKAIALLATCSWVASRERDGDHQGFISSVAAMAGTLNESESTIYRVVRELEAVNLLRRIPRKDERGRDLPPIWVIGPFSERGVTHDRGVTRDAETDTPNARARDGVKNKEGSPDGEHVKMQLQDAPADDPVETIFIYWKNTIPGKSRMTLTDDRRKIIKARLAKKTPAELCRAIDGVLRDPWLLGENDRRRAYTDFSTIFKNDSKIEDLIELADHEIPQPPAAAETMEERHARREAHWAEVARRQQEEREGS